MNNEILLIISLLFIYTTVLFSFFIFDKEGLYCWVSLATILANIEVLILVKAFGMEQTLGNILFASTFLVTDILSEIYGFEKSKKATNIGIFTSLIFVVLTQSWMLYQPSENDFIFYSISQVFKNTPRMVIVSFLVYGICQKFDVWAYHKIWNFTNRFSKDKDRHLWVRNNLSTLISQAINSLLFNFGAFWGIHDFRSILSIAFATYIIFVLTSVLDTPFVYLARKIYKKYKA